MEDSNALKLMKAVSKKTIAKLPDEDNMNIRFDKERIKTKDGSLRWRNKAVPQYGLYSKTKIVGRVQKTKNEFGDQVLRELDVNGKVLGEVTMIDAPSRPK